MMMTRAPMGPMEGAAVDEVVRRLVEGGRGDPGVSGGEHPLERGEAVVVPGRERVLGRQAVVDGHDERRARGGQPVEEEVVAGRRGHEAAAVDVHDDGQLGAGAGAVGGHGGQVEAGGVGAEVDVLGLDPRGSVVARIHGRGHQGPLDAAALVDPEQRAELAHDLVGRVGGRDGEGEQ